MEYTITLNEQQYDFLLVLLDVERTDDTYDNTSNAIINQIITKLEEVK